MPFPVLCKLRWYIGTLIGTLLVKGDQDTVLKDGIFYMISALSDNCPHPV